MAKILDVYDSKKPLRSEVQLLKEKNRKLQDALLEIMDSYTTHSPWHMREVARKAIKEFGH